MPTDHLASAKYSHKTENNYWLNNLFVWSTSYQLASIGDGKFQKGNLSMTLFIYVYIKNQDEPHSASVGKVR